jgi:Transglutaminase-like superfamily
MESFRMSFLVLKAYLTLILFDVYVARGNFSALHDKVRRCPVAKMAPPPDAVERICAAIDMACIWYWKTVLCLQRSSATACLLKQYGVCAQMVIGAQQLPFKAHAWVEVDGKVVNDKPYMKEIYAVLERC